ncbi:unnamed protein product, partial [Gongylonema pulchrum]|uniref:Snurportin-1 n=1 Tax=Gongylonema pulchrum TaxID=637853 RepID=A0A183D3X4_9BILA
VDTAPNSTAREHPRFSQYKYTGRAEENQENRRREYLQRQKEMRFDYANHARKLAMNEFDEEDDKMDMEAENEEVDEAEMEEAGSEGKKKKWRKYSKKAKKERIRRNRYANELMLSEWLVDIPTTLSKDWICLPCPTGKRCLVVASNGVTTAYAKTGFMITQFRSYLPVAVEIQLEEKIPHRKSLQYRFVCLPYCRCENSLMEEMMHREFEFELDGVLFYHANVRYEKGQSPLGM